MSEGENHQVDANVEKAKVYLELAKMSQESFVNRRSYEWKVAFGFWTAIGLFTYFAIENADTFGNEISGTTFWIYVILFASWFLLWQLPLRIAFEDDKDYKHYYMNRAEGRTAVWPRDRKQGDDVSDNSNAESESGGNGKTQPNKKKWWDCADYKSLLCTNDGHFSWRRFSWTLGQTAFTALFLVGSWYLISAAAAHAENEAKPKDRVFEVIHHDNDKTVFTIWWPKN